METFSHLWLSCWIIIRIRNNNNGTLHGDVFTFMTISHWILVRMWNVSGESCRENYNTHFMFNNFFFSQIVLFMRSCQKIWWSQRGYKWQYNTAHVRCWVSKATCARTHTYLCIRAPTQTSTQACTHLRAACSLSLAHARTHTHTEKYVILLLFHGHSGFVNVSQGYIMYMSLHISFQNTEYICFTLY